MREVINHLTHIHLLNTIKSILTQTLEKLCKKRVYGMIDVLDSQLMCCNVYLLEWIDRIGIELKAIVLYGMKGGLGWFWEYLEIIEILTNLIIQFAL